MAIAAICDSGLPPSHLSHPVSYNYQTSIFSLNVDFCVNNKIFRENFFFLNPQIKYNIIFSSRKFDESKAIMLA